jgi:hypothetical protein
MLLLLASPSAQESRNPDQPLSQADWPLILWAQPPGSKIRPFDPPVGVAAPAGVLGAGREGVATQIVLTNTGESPLTGLSPELGPLVGPASAVLPVDAVQLYRVGYVDVLEPSDPAGAVGEWPDPLYPIGRDRYYHEQRNGAPFDLAPGRNQPVWIDIRIPPDAVPGVYTATFRVLQAGTLVAELPFSLTVWGFTLPETTALASTAALNTWTTFCTHFYPGASCIQNSPAREQLVDLYLTEGVANHLTLTTDPSSIAYTYDAVSDRVTSVNWVNWDRLLRRPGATSYPLPPPDFDWNDPSHVWTQVELHEAIALWRAAGEHYRATGWFERSFLYTYDEPANARNGYTPDQQKRLVAQQSLALRAADPQLRALVTSGYDPFLALNAAIGIWAPEVQQLDSSPELQANYAGVRSAGKHLWWYDSNDSREPDHRALSGLAAHHGNWPDEFIDHSGANQLVHGPLSWKYRLDGFLYYEVTAAYSQGDVWHWNSYAGTNGDGTLFYPGRPQDIGGNTHIPVPSIRLQLLRESWSLFDELSLLASRGEGDVADAMADRLVSSASEWSHDPNAYERTREEVAQLLSGDGLGANGVVIDGALELVPAQLQTGTLAEARFAARNAGQQPVTVPYLMVGARDPSGANVNFPTVGPVNLQPGASYVYAQTRALPGPGSYTLWPALFDGTTWIDLAPRATLEVN